LQVLDAGELLICPWRPLWVAENGGGVGARYRTAAAGMGITEGHMTMIVAGIDPGLTGAIAILSLLWGE